MASLLHRAADMDLKPTIKETKFLLPKPALSAREIKPPQWVSMVRKSKKKKLLGAILHTEVFNPLI